MLLRFEFHKTDPYWLRSEPLHLSLVLFPISVYLQLSFVLLGLMIWRFFVVTVAFTKGLTVIQRKAPYTLDSFTIKSFLSLHSFLQMFTTWWLPGLLTCLLAKLHKSCWISVPDTMIDKINVIGLTFITLTFSLSTWKLTCSVLLHYSWISIETLVA